MKKNFFKKLSFVLALAMVIAAIAPAAGAFAATGLRLNATTKTLFLGENDKYNFNVLGASAGATQKWTSSNTSVATVNAKNGVVAAKAVGATTITATVTNAKKTVTKKLTAKVTVGDNVKALSVVAPADADKLVIGKDYNFSATYVTLGGSKTKTSNSIVWSVDKEGATISKAGVFTATEPGEYTVTATANRYKNVKVTDASVKVTVVPSVVSTKQYNTTKLVVTFDADMSKTDIKTASVVSKVVNGVKVSSGTEKVKSVTLDSTGKVATVELYAKFVPGTVYDFTYGTLSGTFKAAATDAKYITGIIFDDFNVETSTIPTAGNMYAYVHAVNADNVIIAEGADIASSLTFTYSGDAAKGYIISSAGTAYINTKGYVAPITAKYTSFVYNETTKAYETVSFEDAANATGVTADTNVNGATLQAVVTNGLVADIATSAWTAPITLAAKDTGYRIVTRYKLNNALPTTNYTTNDGTSTFIYESTNTDKLLISGQSVYAVAAGTVTVIVKTNDTAKTVVGTFDVVIKDARTFAAVSQDVASVSLGNASGSAAESKAVTFTVSDTLNAPISVVATTEVVAKPAGTSIVVGAPQYLTGKDLGKVKFNVTANGAAVGAYNVKVTFTSGTVTKTAYFTVVVLDATSNASATTVAQYKLELDNASSVSVDLKDITAAKNLVLSLNGYNAAGARVQVVTPSAYTITVKDVAGNTESVYNSGNIEVVTVSGGTLLVPVAVDTYSVTATVTGSAIGNYAVNSTIGYASFAVTDSTVKTVAVDTTVATIGTSLLQAVKDSYTFKLNDTAIDETKITAVTYTKGAAAPVKDGGSVLFATSGETYYISSIEYTVTTSGVDKVYTFTVGSTITAK